ncbi:MAG: dephospho-CoA kinase [Chloroflexota bacterium]
MSAWPDKYVIGLTGNIATGKSVVRKMLEHLGAYGIDADALGHRAMAKGAPGYQPIIDNFGKWILNADGQVNRAKLARIIFPDPEALTTLEEILHPLIRQAIDLLINRANHKVIVIEAIKLLESSMNENCDAVWVTHAPQEIQMARLTQKRNMVAAAAQERIVAQGSQAYKMKAADILIENTGSFEKTWEQVLGAWNDSVTIEKVAPEEEIVEISPAGFSVERAGPGAASEIARFITSASQGQLSLTRTDIMAAFGEKAFVLLRHGSNVIGVMGWQVENLIARVDDVFLLPGDTLEDAIETMIKEVEEASYDLQCEAAMLFLPPKLARHKKIWKDLGYATQSVKLLSVRAWQEAATESMPPGTVLLFKKLRKNRVLRPV